MEPQMLIPEPVVEDPVLGELRGIIASGGMRPGEILIIVGGGSQRGSGKSTFMRMLVEEAVQLEIQARKLHDRVEHSIISEYSDFISMIPTPAERGYDYGSKRKAQWKQETGPGRFYQRKAKR